MADYVCPDCGFASTDWPTKKLANDRGKQHQTEHETGKPMPELADFRTQEG